MNKWLVVVLVAAIVAAVGVSCKRADPEADKASIQGIVERDSVWFDGSTTVDSTGGGYIDGDTAVIWWRSAQTHDEPDIEISLVGDSAWVEWSRHNFGDFYTLAKPPDTTWLLWSKKVVETARLRGVFTRVGEETEDDRGWELTGLSLASGRSDSAQSAFIDSLRIESATAGNVLIIDPLNTYYSLASLIWFTPGEAVTVTLYTNIEDGDAFLHTWAFWYRRLPFTNTGGGVFTGTWNAQLLPFPRFAIFDLVTHGTIYEPGQPYDFCGWLFPYTIRTAD